ncbi:inorganic phosphate transporter [Mesosutterella sp. OilRF-GAM-744-9]|uniref:Phosphate transporter n=1 Tax=Mesosutterella porci TaxID=2915351 RepID=A0ABS9MRU3_9BURK|nr:inorganic phosphate transporter [Mesosutterella sp. oilRF-744-WT-GAM-9]MCG5030728.1 inorganic phosphate transporter [Mesosutterella sp. oilRF-744-WT-GAM-9]
MDIFFWVVLGFLALLAVIDLFVGVSNDAVNFLNSAVGSRIAPFKVILTVAGVGVLLGATFSGGMMGIARSGVFHPAMFSFSDVIAIYFAVMVTDVILLNAFNRMGLPTSTTVSIVFELLGAGAGMAANRLIGMGEGLSALGDYLNSGKAFGMISAILVSVVVAFVAGALVQWVTRLVFSFRYDLIFRKLGGIYGGFSLAMIFYFLVMKGAKGASFMTPEVLEFFRVNGSMVVLGIFVVCSILLQIGMMLFHLNVFRLVILAGTFALAFAFAGNDLVNFVGVPIAALDAAHIFEAAGGADPSGFMMGGLAEAIPAPGLLLLLSGVVMVATLFLSKSARKVIETSVNLSASSNGTREKFGATPLGRAVVRGSMALGDLIHAFVPAGIQRGINRRFEPKVFEKGEEALPFDYIRASLNLIVSAILIASATSLKLPLSTTYVTFMVAMGSSFADRAWDRETAVYRVSGVITVISGWFVTAFSAFIAAAVMVSIVNLGGFAAYLVLMALVLFIIFKTNVKSSREKEMDREVVALSGPDGIRTKLEKSIPANFGRSADLFALTVDSFLSDNLPGLKKAVNLASEQRDRISDDRALYYAMPADTEGYDSADSKYFYYRSCTGMKEAASSLIRTVSLARDHVANRHRIFSGDLATELQAVAHDLVALKQPLEKAVRHGDKSEFQLKLHALNERIDRIQETVLGDREHFGLSLRGAELYMNFLQFLREILGRYTVVTGLESRLTGREKTERAAGPSRAAAG